MHVSLGHHTPPLPVTVTLNQGTQSEWSVSNQYNYTLNTKFTHNYAHTQHCQKSGHKKKHQSTSQVTSKPSASDHDSNNT